MSTVRCMTVSTGNRQLDTFMVSLTRELDDRHSPVSRWMREHFPYHREIQTEVRRGAGITRIRPVSGVAVGTQGSAIEWWLRFLVDPQPSLSLPLSGVARAMDEPCWVACVELVTQQLHLDLDDPEGLLFKPTDFADRPDHWWARVSYAMALMVELYRTNGYENSRLFLLPPGSTADNVLNLITEAEIDDLIAMRDFAIPHLMRLPAGPVFSGPTFEGSRDLAGDADIIIGGTLLEVKATQGGQPRKDGTRVLSLERQDIHQMLGYALMDYHNEYELTEIALYAPRFGYLRRWSIGDYCHRLAGRRIDLGETRDAFRTLLQHELPPYHQQRYGIPVK